MFDFQKFCADQKKFSEKAFGPNNRYEGICDHIKKELEEVILVRGKDASEWADVIVLAIDGAWRAGITPQQLEKALIKTLEKNKKRTWPDWKTADPKKAIEHTRGKDE